MIAAGLVAGDPVAWCTHPQARHMHGTRVAYVKDRCRCAACTAANTAASNTRHRQQTFGRWAPFVDAAPVREHVHQLRAAGIGTDQIAALAGVSPSHVRALIYPTHAGRPPISRVRPATADRVLSVTAQDTNRAARSLLDATGTRRRLQALMATGWTLHRLAEQLSRTPANLRRTLAAEQVTAATAGAVRGLYDQLENTAPPADSDADRADARSCRDDALARGWLPPLAWDDIDTDADPAPAPATAAEESVDDIAAERAATGDHTITLTAAEELEVVRRLTQNGRSTRQIAELLDTSSSTISRRRRQIAAA